MKLMIKLFFVIVYISAILPAQSTPDTSANLNGITGFPIIFYTPETRWAFGAGGIYFYRQNTVTELPTSFSISFVYTQNKQAVVGISSNMYLTDGSLWHKGDFGYIKYPNTFFGIGNATPDSSKEQFTIEGFRLNPSLLKKLSDHFYAGPQILYESWSLLETEAGKLLSPGNIPGSQSTVVTGIGLVFNYDERDNLFAPHSGRYYQAAISTSPTFLGSTFGFSWSRIDIREYIPLGDNHVLSGQVLFHSTSGTVPFRFLSQLGGQSMMRGYFEGRYSDRHLYAAQVEYRTPLIYRLGLVLFGAAGDVSNNLGNFQLRSMKTAFGAGIRIAFIPEERINLRIDFGVGKESGGVYINLGEAF